MKMLYRNGDIYHGTNFTLDLCLSKKKKVKPTYRPCFFLARNLKHNYFFCLTCTSFPSLFLHFISMNCTGKIVQVGLWKVGNFINGKIEEKKFE